MAKFNFRSTSGYVTDGAGETYFIFGDTHPTSRDSLTFGWTGANPQFRDRSTGVDVRLAGTLFRGNDGQTLIVYDCGNGTYDVSGAFGDQGSAATNYIEICDVNTSNVVQSVLSTVASGTATALGEFVDAGGTVRTSASDWVTNGSTVTTQVTVTSGRIGIRLGPSSTQSGSSAIAHLAVAPASGGGSSLPIFRRRR